MKKTESYIESSSGFILIGDIVGFSKEINDFQRDLVLHLWKFLNSHPMLANGSGNQAILNGTGDGALIAFPRNSDRRRNDGKVIHWREAVSLARAWSQWMSHKIGRDAARPRLRIGIHQGPFQIVNVAKLEGLAKHGGFQVVGSAPNTCARVAGLGDGGDIVMSKEFIDSWKNSSQIESAIRFDPELTDPELQAFVKHGESIRIRRLDRGGRVSAKLEAIALVQGHFYQTLQGIEELFIKLLNEEIANGKQKRAQFFRESLSARISIWKAAHDQQHLVCLPLRWHFQDRFALPGRTKYSINGSGAGAPGRAYRSEACKPVIVTKLPAVDRLRPKTLDNYCRSLSRQTGLDPSIIRSFSCFSRSFITFGVSLDKNRPDAVVCIDCENPLEGLNKAEMTRAAIRVQATLNTAMASLVRLYVG